MWSSGSAIIVDVDAVIFYVLPPFCRDTIFREPSSWIIERDRQKIQLELAAHRASPAGRSIVLQVHV